MSISIVATVGASTANSYVTLAEANTYFEAHPDWITWDKMDTPTKQRWLILATNQIDALPIDGTKYTTTATSGVPDQRLKFPRAVDYDDATQFIPLAVKLAVYEQAISLEKGGTGGTRQTLRNEGVRRAKVGDVEEEYIDGGTKSHELCPRAYAILSAAGLIQWGAAL